jgi:hypothetical protein
MEEPFTVHLDDIPVRFTPDGKVFVIDAIKATMQSKQALAIWETLKSEHPEILAYYEDYAGKGKTPLPVADSSGWEMIMRLLFSDLADDDHQEALYSALAG